jgi:hypothetical protein
MVVRRKYKDGGRVATGAAQSLPRGSVDVTIPEEVPAVPSSAASDDDAILHAAQATMRAEQLQRAQMRQARPSIEEIIDNIPDLSGHKRAFLKEHPEFVVDGFRQSLLRKHYAAALASGIADDTPEINRAVLDGIQRDLEHVQALAAAPVRSDPAPAPQPPPPQAPAIRRNMPMTAPVSRDVPTPSGQRAADFRTVTLTAEERLIARNSFTDPGMSNEEKELLYARNKARYQQMLASGEYTDARHQR